MNKHWIFFISIFFVLTAIECTDELPEAPEGYEAVYLKDYSGLDGCGWVFESESGYVYEPQNLNDFSIHMYDNKRYFIKYTLYPDIISICMVGEIIIITDIIDAAVE